MVGSPTGSVLRSHSPAYLSQTPPLPASYGIGKFAQGSLNNIFNPNWKSYEWVDMGMGISKPLTPSSIPGIAGNTGAAIATEGSGAIINEQINSLQEKK